MEYVIANGGIASEGSYPYQPSDGHCQSDRESDVVASISGYNVVPIDDAGQMAAAVAKTPVSIAVEATGEAFYLYRGGVLTDASCGHDLNHAVLMVGYTDASDASYPDAWIVKNSWGTNWGVDGYVYITRDNSRDRHGVCGVLLQGAYGTGASVVGRPTPMPTTPGQPTPLPTTPRPGPLPTPRPTVSPDGDFYENPYDGSCGTNEYGCCWERRRSVHPPACTT